MTTVLGPAPRVSALGVLADQVRYTVTGYWRSRTALLMSLLIPLVWLFMIGALAGNEVLDPTTGLRVMQFATPGALAMGTLFATLPSVAVTVTEARETGLLKRLRGTPLPAWAYLAGRGVGAAILGFVAVAVALVVAVVAYDVQVLGRTALASVATVVVAMTCFVTLGLAVSAVCRSSTTAQAVSVGGVVALSFASGLFTIGGTLPTAVTRVADLLPLAPFAEALQRQFDPFVGGAGWDLRALAVTGAWTVVGAVVASVGWRRREADVARAAAPGDAPTSARRVTPTAARPAPLVATAGRGGVPTQVAAQLGAALRSLVRDPGTLFFAVLMPVGLYALVATVTDPDLLVRDLPYRVHLAAGMIAWGLAVTAFMNIPEAVVRARDRGVLKRLRGTPLPPSHYVVGRLLAAVLVSLVVAVLVLVVGVLGFGMPLRAGALLPAAALVALGALVMSACGFLLAALVRNGRTFAAVSLTVLLPVAFLSDIFTVGGPAWMGAVGSLLPLKHLQNGLGDVLAGSAGADLWWHVLVLAAWGLAAGALAVRRFRWHPPEER